MASVSYQGATRLYAQGARPAVDAIDLDIADGEFLVLVGPSGCGKTTTLRMLAGLEPVDAGSIFIGDTDVTQTPPKDRDIAMVFQNYALYPHMTVEQNMAFSLEMAGVAKTERHARVKAAAEMLDLEPYLDRKPKALSGGQRQRVAMGRAIVRRPKVFLMDEPLSNLDAKLRVQTRSAIAKLQRELGVTTVYVTHDQTEAMTMGDRVAILNEGRVQQLGTPQELYAAPVNTFVAGFIGSPAMNLVPVAGGVTVGVRPEDLEVVTDGGGIDLEVEIVEELGADSYLYGFADIDGKPAQLVARVDGRAHPRPGDRVRVAPRRERIHTFSTETGERIEADVNF